MNLKFGNAALVIASVASMAFVAIGAGGCSSTSSTEPAETDAAPPKRTETKVDAAAPAPPAGADAGGGGVGSGPCTEANSVCMSFTVPAALPSAPARLFVGFFKELPPGGPPDKMGPQVNAPEMKAGEKYTLKLTDADVKGDYFVYTVLYMPGGGQFVPKKGVDYVAETPKAHAFTGAPMTLDTLDFKLSE